MLQILITKSILYLEAELNLVICYLLAPLLLFSRAMLEATSSPVVFCHNDCQEGKLALFSDVVLSLFLIICLLSET